MFGIYEKDGHQSNTLCSYPTFLPSKKTSGKEGILFNSTIYKGSFDVSPENHLIALAYNRFNMIDIYGPDGSLLNRITGPEHVDITVERVSPKPGMVLFDPKPKYMAYRKICAGPQEIWATHSGVVLTRDNYEETIPRRFFCFSWEGDLLRELIFDIGILDFSIDWENGKLYCISENNMIPCIYSFSINNI